MVILSNVEQGSSSSSSYSHDNNNNHKPQRYDVFLSFRGADTRNNFTDHLYNALIDAGINTFLDEEEIDTGEDLKPELEDAIRSSRASVIVLSKSYATSTWCLDELALILDQRLTWDHIVIPIFYHVDPTHVRKQQNSFGDAMREHRRKKLEAETNAEKRVRWAQKMDRWIKALTDVADLKGKDVNGRKEVEFIEEIVTEISQRLVVPISDTLPLLIGRNCHIEEFTSWLTDGSTSHTIDILTVSGIGGIGKTTLAKHVFYLFYHTFEKSSFIEGINLRCTGKFNGLLEVQKQLYDNISKKNKLQVHDTCVYTSRIEKALARVKMLLVLDDIDSLDQLDVLLGNKGFHPGSKIIITTRDASLTERCALFNLEVEPKHTTLKIEGLYEIAARELLCLYAFKRKVPKNGYKDVLIKLVKYCEGHPLALEVLGKFLRNRDIAYWEACIENLKKETHLGIRKVLQMSFDSLPFPNDKELFKHIACFFVGIDREISEKILRACDINTVFGIPNLIDRCLLSIDKWDNSLKMHQLIQEMGKAIVLEESPDEPGKRSRLCCHDESFKVLKKKNGTTKLKGLVLDTRMLDKENFCDLQTDAFSNMDNLMILHLNYVQCSGPYNKFPDELRWLRMHGSPLKSIPSDILMEKLVVLDMSYSNIESFDTCCSSCNPQALAGWQKRSGLSLKDRRLLGSLKILDLSFCEQLRSLSSFFELPALERLIVRNCISLTEISDTIEQCVEFVFIDMSYCHNLEKLPTSLGKLKKVKTLLLDGCNLGESRIKVIDKDSPGLLNKKDMVESVPRDLKSFAISLPCSLVRLSLKGNKLSSKSFPREFSSLFVLKDLHLDGNPIVSMPACVGSLPRLETLTMYDCKLLTSIERPPCTLRVLSHNSYSNSPHGSKLFLRKILFNPEMSPLLLLLDLDFTSASSIEIEGILKIQHITDVEKNLLCSLGWNNLSRGLEGSQSQSQMYYEFGIFSTFFWGEEMPDWITQDLSVTGAAISFTIPFSNELRGLKFCYVQRSQFSTGAFQLPGNMLFHVPLIKVSNITKNYTWIYKHCIRSVSVGGKCFICLSNWMFGENEMEGGDQVTITVTEDYGQCGTACGVSFVYDDGSIREQDALGYYKSWNHIIGGDLSAFQVTTGEYILYVRRFFMGLNLISSHIYRSLMPGNPSYIETNVPFRAFS